MTDPTQPPIESPLDAPTELPAPIVSTMQSIGLGCLGFVGFFVLAAIVIPMSLGAGAVGGVVIALVLIVVAVGAFRSATPRGRAQLVRVAVGFGLALVVFGGCLAMLSGANFH